MSDTILWRWNRQPRAKASQRGDGRAVKHSILLKDRTTFPTCSERKGGRFLSPLLVPLLNFPAGPAEGRVELSLSAEASIDRADRRPSFHTTTPLIPVRAQIAVEAAGGCTKLPPSSVILCIFNAEQQAACLQPTGHDNN